MVFISVFIFLISSNVLGAEALVKVLETPLFTHPDYNAEVIQYKRKGEKVIIHNSHLQKETQKSEFLIVDEKELKHYNQEFLENYLTNEITDIPEEFVKTTDRLGRDAYMIKEHLAILYYDSRELSEKRLDYDPTDYRLEEPLSETHPSFPFKEKYEVPYEGILSLGYINSIDRAYEYRERILKASLTQGFTLGAVWSKRKSKELEEPIFWGYQMQAKFSEARYRLSTRNAREKHDRLGFGVYGHWAFYEQKDFRLNLNGGLRFNIFDTTEVRQTERATESVEKRSFKGPSATAHSGLFYQNQSSLYKNLSFIVGYDFAFTLPFQQQTKNTADNPTWWQGGVGERLGPQLKLEQSLYIGLLVVD